MTAEEKREKRNSPAPFRVTDRRFWAQGEETEEGAEVRPSYPTFVEELLGKVEEKDRKLRDYISAYKKMEADTEEYRLRLNRDIEKKVEETMAGFFSEFLEIVDNLNRAIGTARESQNVDSLLEGVEMIRDQMMAKLSGRGVTPMEAVGEQFDPRVHEAVQVIPVDNEDENDKVLKVVEDGYMLGERLIRPAKVGVGKVKEERPGD